MINVEVEQVRGTYEGFSWRGSCGSLPQPGRTFGIIFSDGDKRLVLHTTTVLSVDGGPCNMFFETSNSSYTLRVLEAAGESAA